jgi:hypothetical protein
VTSLQDHMSRAIASAAIARLLDNPDRCPLALRKYVVSGLRKRANSSGRRRAMEALQRALEAHVQAGNLPAILEASNVE